LSPALVDGLNASAERGGHSSIDWSQARQVAHDVWLVAAGEDVCLHVGTADHGAAGCGTAAPGLASGQSDYITGQYAGSDPFTTGVVPDGVTSVDVMFAGGSTTEVPVINNTYTASAATAVNRVSYVLNGTTVSQDLPAITLP
jgi:hypothetical protein